VYVQDVARAVRLALASEDSRGEIFNVAERSTPSMRLLAQQILEAADWTAELVRVPEGLLPEDLKVTRAVAQDLLMDASKARAILRWEETDPDVWLRRSVAWHLEHPPDDLLSFDADDAALSAHS
jgi:nucleoside-diphosphate-sugar epimerase